MKYAVAGQSLMGKKREVNQDAYMVHTNIVDGQPQIFIVLCDGMGGLKEGEMASAVIAHAFSKWYQKEAENFLFDEINSYHLRNQWEKVIKECNDLMDRYGKEKGIQIGSTLTLGLFYKNYCYMMNVGDSRIYRIDTRVHKISQDHTLVSQEVELGHITKEQAESDGRRNILLQCVGIGNAVFPHYVVEEINEDCCYLFCSDGFYNDLDEDDIYEKLISYGNWNNEMLTKHIHDLIQKKQEMGERDDISAVAVVCMEDDYGKVGDYHQK